MRQTPVTRLAPPSPPAHVVEATEAKRRSEAQRRSVALLKEERQARKREKELLLAEARADQAHRRARQSHPSRCAVVEESGPAAASVLAGATTRGVGKACAARRGGDDVVPGAGVGAEAGLGMGSPSELPSSREGGDTHEALSASHEVLRSDELSTPRSTSNEASAPAGASDPPASGASASASNEGAIPFRLLPPPSSPSERRDCLSVRLPGGKIVHTTASDATVEQAKASSRSGHNMSHPIPPPCVCTYVLVHVYVGSCSSSSPAA